MANASIIASLQKLTSREEVMNLLETCVPESSEGYAFGYDLVDDFLEKLNEIDTAGCVHEFFEKTEYYGTRTIGEVVSKKVTAGNLKITKKLFWSNGFMADIGFNSNWKKQIRACGFQSMPE
jgi:hypothetical protein